MRRTNLLFICLLLTLLPIANAGITTISNSRVSSDEAAIENQAVVGRDELHPTATLLVEGATVINGSLAVNGTLIGKTNSYLEGAVQTNASYTAFEGTGSGGSPSAMADNIIVDSSVTSGAGITILTPNTGNAQIRFGDPQDNGVGFMQYTHATNTYAFGAAGVTRLTLDSTGLHTVSSIEIDDAFNHDGANFGAFGVAPATQCAKIADPSGGITTDAQARAAINLLIDALERFGFCASV